ncbi:MAG: hypothetical protein WDN04_26770 [Rhodospirillales bacterium]
MPLSERIATGRFADNERASNAVPMARTWVSAAGIRKAAPAIARALGEKRALGRGAGPEFEIRAEAARNRAQRLRRAQHAGTVGAPLDLHRGARPGPASQTATLPPPRLRPVPADYCLISFQLPFSTRTSTRER